MLYLGRRVAEYGGYYDGVWGDFVGGVERQLGGFQLEDLDKAREGCRFAGSRWCIVAIVLRGYRFRRLGRWALVWSRRNFMEVSTLVA